MKSVFLAVLAAACLYGQSTPVNGGRTIQGGVNVCTESGAGNTYTCAFPAGATISAYSTGTTYTFVTAHGNTGAATLNIDGVGAKAIVKQQGSAPLASGDIVAGAATVVAYDGAQFQLLTPLTVAASSGGGASGPAVSASAPLYLYAHFRDDDAYLYLSYSYDGYHWKNITPQGVHSIPGVRDITVMYAAGKFHFAATYRDDNHGAGFAYWTSADLVNFSSFQTIPIPGVNETASGHGGVWSPEWFVDPNTGNTYVVAAGSPDSNVFSFYLFSYNPANGTFGNTASNITPSGSARQLIFDPLLTYSGGTYRLYYVDDQVPSGNNSAQYVTYATSSTLTGAYAQKSAPIDFAAFGAQAEAPSPFVLPTGCVRMLADTFIVPPISATGDYGPRKYNVKYADSCDGFATHTTPTRIDIPAAEQGSVIPITTAATAAVVLNAREFYSKNVIPSRVGFGVENPYFPVEIGTTHSFGSLSYNEAPALGFNNTGDPNNETVLFGCYQSGVGCPTPPATTGTLGIFSSLTGNTAKNGIIQIGTSTPGSIASIGFIDGITQFGGDVPLYASNGNAWVVGNNTPGTAQGSFGVFNPRLNLSPIEVDKTGVVKMATGNILALNTTSSNPAGNVWQQSSTGAGVPNIEYQNNPNFYQIADTTNGGGNGILQYNYNFFGRGPIDVVFTGLQFNMAGKTRPVCDNITRSVVWPVVNGTGVADAFTVCQKDSSDTFNWNTFGSGSSPSSPGATTGYGNVAPNANTSKTSNFVAVGDSHIAGYGQTTPIVQQISPSQSYTLTNLAVSGTKFCAYFADNGTREAQVDALYNPQARSNFLLIEGGGNDMIDNNTGTPAVPYITAQQVYDCQVGYAKRRKALGWTIVLYGMYSRSQTGIGGSTGDQLHDQLNALYNAGWKSWADAYVNVSADSQVGQDGNYSNTTYFQSDGIHVQSSYTATLANLLTVQINNGEFGAKYGGTADLTNIQAGNTDNTIAVTTATTNLSAWIQNNTGAGMHAFAYYSSTNWWEIKDLSANFVPIHYDFNYFGNGPLTSTFAGFRIASQGTRPPCNANSEGELWHSFGGSGVASALTACGQSSAGVFAWHVVHQW